MLEQYNTLTPKEVARALRVSEAWVYRNKHALGGYQAKPGGRLLFFEDEIERRIKHDAVQDEKRQLPGAQDDKRQAQNKNMQNQKGGKDLGGKTNRGQLVAGGDRHNILG